MLRLSQALPIACLLILLFNTSPSQQTSTDLPIVENAGFEVGLSGWQEIHAPASSVAATNARAHSGSAALAITLAPPPPNAVAVFPIVEGVFQSSNVTNMEGLKLEAWYLLHMSTYLVAAKVRIQVGSLTIDYYVVKAPNTALSNTTTTRSIVVSLQNCVASWCLLQADVGADFRSNFDLASGSVFQTATRIPIKIALELLLYGGTETQFMFWDDVQLIASIPAQSTTTQTTSSEPSTQLNSISTTQTTLRTIGVVSTATMTSTVTSIQTVGFTLTREQSFLILLPALILILAAILIDVMRRRNNSAAKDKRKSSKAKLAGIRCYRCGGDLRRGDRFCDRCGAKQ